MYDQNKQASTKIPLTPEERYEASQLVGGSLFSALQMMKENERRKNMQMSSGEEGDGKVLRIPIPKNLMPEKMAAETFDEPGYLGTEDPYTPEEGRGLLAHFRRNAGKYVGTLAGGMLGGGLRIRSKMKADPNLGFMDTLWHAGRGGTRGSLLGLAGGVIADDAKRDEAREDVRRNHLARQAAMMSPEMLGYKEASDDQPELGMFARAFKAQNNPVKMLVGAQSGFKNAKKDYYMQQRQLVQQELMDAQKDYIDTLSRIKSGSVKEETPYVDAFCNGIAYGALFEKTANDDADISDDSISRLMGDVMSTAKKPFKPAIDTAASGLLGTAGGSAYLTYLLRKTMREEPEKYMQEHLPTKVELQPYE